MAPSILLTSHPAPGIVLVTLNRPESANALNTQLAQKLAGCFKALKGDVRAVVLTGAGRHFCAGADLKERAGMNERQWESQHLQLRAARDAVLNCPYPVIAAANGGAYGGGLELLLAADFIYASENAKFALTEATLGIMPGMGGVQALSRAVGARRAKELMMTGRAFSAAEASGWGLVSRACPPEQLMADVLETAMLIASNAPLSVRAIKHSLCSAAHLPLAKAFEVERKAYATLIPTKDRREGIAAFNEKRKAEFKGV